jgi:hypothetical protein
MSKYIIYNEGEYLEGYTKDNNGEKKPKWTHERAFARIFSSKLAAVVEIKKLGRGTYLTV